MQKVIFFDVDGTLMDHQSVTEGIPENAKKQMRRLQVAGYKLFIASGRPYAFISKTISDFGFDGYVLCNGAHVEIDGKYIYHEVLDRSRVQLLINALKELGCEYILETSRHAYLNPKYHVLKEFFVRCDINEDLLCFDFNEEEVMADVLKLEINAAKMHLDTIEKLLNENFNYDCHGTENAFEVYSNVVTKATGVKKVMEYLQLPLENTYAFGDGLNDIEMLQVVGHGVAMENAVPELKAVANEVCGHVGEDGLAKALEKLH